MRAWRGHRRWLPGWLVAVVLFAQLATAAYACPQGVATVAGSGAVEQAAMPDCGGDMGSGMDAGQPLLCQAHCQAGDQTTGAQPSGVDLPAAQAFGTWPRIPLVADPLHEGPAAAPPAGGANGPPGSFPPLYIALLVLRN